MLGELSQDFAIEFDVVFFKLMNEAAVGESERPNGGVNFDLPESAEITFFLSAVPEGVSAGVKQGLARRPFFFASAVAKALGRLEYSTAPFQTNGSSFDSWHKGKLIQRQVVTQGFCPQGKRHRSFPVQLFDSSGFSVEMVMTARSRQDFSPAGDF